MKKQDWWKQLHQQNGYWIIGVIFALLITLYSLFSGFKATLLQLIVVGLLGLAFCTVGFIKSKNIIIRIVLVISSVVILVLPIFGHAI